MPASRKHTFELPRLPLPPFLRRVRVTEVALIQPLLVKLERARSEPRMARTYVDDVKTAYARLDDCHHMDRASAHCRYEHSHCASR
jgi:hypothetical protein